MQSANTVQKNNKQLLVIEDDQDDFHTLTQLFKKLPDYDLTNASTLTSGLAMLDQSFDLVLLDLSLPDNSGPEAIKLIADKSPVPVVVLTGLADEAVAMAALKFGAQDYLVKGKFGAELMAKTVLYAIERYRLQNELDEARSFVSRQREQQRLESTSTSAPADQGLLRERDPTRFRVLCETYQSILEDSLRQRTFRVEHNVSGQLRELARQCGAMNMIPRDLVELHTEALREKTSTASAKKNSAYSEEGMFQLVGLMGYLCDHYKNQALTT